ncbi:uncharacterized protein EI90DRAFT_2178505 [Cantharellus anzutake]|uniref:uncharacterized protein n=1 Tax=Cantharellus anzutake TaxID=1750568 RepID=UPI001906BC9D|nr:uncharacterized protein EI90DRAFT_2178505 [Cantharellus anzutake]KAF8325205.1 hypothetical protein EI90DRAFT_2178505 [Cantharellus anzutake]
MLYTLLVNAGLILGSILAYLGGSDPNEDLTKGDRVRRETHMTSPLNQVKIARFSSGIFTLLELYLQLTPAPTHPYLISLPDILKRVLPNFSPVPNSASFITGLRVLALFAFIAGGALRLWAIHTLGRLFTFTLTIREGHKLITSGPYAYVRNPSYTGFYILWAGGLILGTTSEQAERAIGLRTAIVEAGTLGVASILLFALAATLMVHRNILGPRIKNEEEMLEAEFKVEWEVYTRDVPYKVLPYVW